MNEEEITHRNLSQKYRSYLRLTSNMNYYILHMELSNLKSRSRRKDTILKHTSSQVLCNFKMMRRLICLVCAITLINIYKSDIYMCMFRIQIDRRFKNCSKFRQRYSLKPCLQHKIMLIFNRNYY